jgi:mono/diheme cytochrome c family protein
MATSHTSKGASKRTLAALAIGFVPAACALIVVAGCHAKPGLTSQQAEGKHLYDDGCAHCHEQNDLHLKKVPPDLHGVFTKDKLPEGEPATDAEVVHLLMTGKGMMPSFAYQMSKEQMADLLAYLHTGLLDEKNR